MRFSVTAITPLCKKLGSLLFIFFVLFGVGYQTTEWAELHRAQSMGVPQHMCINQASVIVSSAQLAVPRVTSSVLRGAQLLANLLVYASLPSDAVLENPDSFVLAERSAPGISPRPGAPYGILPLPHAPPSLS